MCDWLREDLHSKQLYSKMLHLEVWTFFLQFAVIYTHRVELVRIIRSQLVPGIRVILSVPTDNRIEQCQACDIQCRSSTSRADKYEEGDQARILLGLTSVLAEHGFNKSLESKWRKN